MAEVYAVTGAFPRHEMYGFTSQMRRAALSIISQIGEGHGRRTYGELRQFLFQARGSLFEIEAQCIAAKRIGYLNDADEAKLMIHVRLVGKALMGFIRWVERMEAKATNRTTPIPRYPPNPVIPNS